MAKPKSVHKSQASRDKRGVAIIGFELEPEYVAAIEEAAALLATRYGFGANRVPRTQALRVLITRGLAALKADKT